MQTIYGENVVQHMLNGKAIARATRGHILVEAALTMKLQNMLCDIEIGTPVMRSYEWKQIEETCRHVEVKELELSEVDCPAITKLQKSIEDLKNILSNGFDTLSMFKSCVNSSGQLVKTTGTSIFSQLKKC